MSSSTVENEHENINEENVPLHSSQTQMSQITPILTEQAFVGGIAENEMIDQIDYAIRRLLTRPNHQSPYRHVFLWAIDEEPNLNYCVKMTIREPPTHM